MKEKVMKNKASKIKEKVSPYVIIVGAILIIYAISLVLPLVFGFMTSLRAKQDYLDNGVLAFPDFSYWASNKHANGVFGNAGKPLPYPFYDNIFGSYTKFFATGSVLVQQKYYCGWNMNVLVDYTSNQTFLDFVLNTVLYAGVSSILAVMAPCIMGYLCAKFPNKLASFLYAFVIVVMVMPIVGTSGALLTLMKKIRLHDTLFGVWIRKITFTNMYFLIFYAYFKGLPDTYSEAAEIDGASFMRIMWKIYIPFAIKMITTTLMLQIVSTYNDYGINKLHLPSRITLAYAAWDFMTNNKSAELPEKLAACLTLSLPMLIFFIVAKNKLMGNITVGGLKG